MTGAVPDWYPFMRAARWMGVAPWELKERSIIWQVWAHTADRAETDAANNPMKKLW